MQEPAHRVLVRLRLFRFVRGAARRAHAPRRPRRTGIRIDGAVHQDARAGSRSAPRSRRARPRPRSSWRPMKPTTAGGNELAGNQQSARVAKHAQLQREAQLVVRGRRRAPMFCSSCRRPDQANGVTAPRGHPPGGGRARKSPCVRARPDRAASESIPADSGAKVWRGCELISARRPGSAGGRRVSGWLNGTYPLSDPTPFTGLEPALALARNSLATAAFRLR